MCCPYQLVSRDRKYPSSCWVSSSDTSSLAGERAFTCMDWRNCFSFLRLVSLPSLSASASGKCSDEKNCAYVFAAVDNQYCSYVRNAATRLTLALLRPTLKNRLDQSHRPPPAHRSRRTSSPAGRGSRRARWGIARLHGFYSVFNPWLQVA